MCSVDTKSSGFRSESVIMLLLTVLTLVVEIFLAVGLVTSDVIFLELMVL